MLAANADIARKGAAYEFLQRVQGLAFLPPDALALDVDEKITNLEAAHAGFDNFYNEVAHAKALAASVPETGKIPEAVRQRYVKVVVMCQIGNGHGVSFGAQNYYYQLIGRFGEPEAKAFAKLLRDQDVASRLQFSSCEVGFRELARQLRDRVSNPATARVLDLVLDSTPAQLPVLGSTTAAQTALAAMNRTR